MFTHAGGVDSNGVTILASTLIPSGSSPQFGTAQSADGGGERKPTGIVYTITDDPVVLRWNEEIV
jgi:hypothetical protein